MLSIRSHGSAVRRARETRNSCDLWANPYSHCTVEADETMTATVVSVGKDSGGGDDDDNGNVDVDVVKRKKIEG